MEAKPRLKLKTIWQLFVVFLLKLFSFLTRHSYAVDVYGTGCRVLVRPSVRRLRPM